MILGREPVPADTGGRPAVRVEDGRLLTGRGRFLDDFALSCTAYAAFVRSPHAHARILAIAAREARAAPGVLAILTGEDYAADGLGLLGCGERAHRRDGTPMRTPPRPALPTDRVRHVGEAVAMVVGETADAARDAAERVMVDYEPLDAVVDAADAAGGDAPPVWEDCPNNEAFVARAGDPDAFDQARAKAAYLVEQRLVNQRVAANTMEPRGAFAVFDGDTGRFSLRAGVHSPHLLRDILARDIFGLPPADFHIATGDIGGSFGMRGATYPELVLVPWAARRLARPVKWTATRSEGLISDDHGRDAVSDACLALDSEGRILGLRVSMTVNLGAYLAIKGPRSPLNALSLLSGVYRIPAFDLVAVGVHTHTNPTSPYRGAGGPEAVYIVERIMDEAARTLGVNRVELRRRNLIGEADMPYDTGLGWVYDSGAFGRTMDIAVQRADLDGFPGRRAASRRIGRLRGIGICNGIEQTARSGGERAALRLDPGGILTVCVGTASQGQGHETVYRQLAGAALGCGTDRIRVVTGDTDAVPAGGGTFNSRSLVCGGTAVATAAERLADAGRDVAAEILEAARADIEFSAGHYTVAGTDRSVSLAETAARTADGLAGEAVYVPDAATFPNGTHICEVEIDPETGKTAVLRYIAVDDVGTVVNPLLLDGQIHGGVAQGIGQAFLERIAFDRESGQNLTGSFMDYAMPRADDLCFVETGYNPVPTALNPLGAKGAGEAGTVGALPAAMCAIVDAIGGDAAEILDMPATPERVWRALRNRGTAIPRPPVRFPAPPNPRPPASRPRGVPPAPAPSTRPA